MGIKAKRAGVAILAMSALAIGSVGLADAASTNTQSKGPGGGPGPHGTPLTGATLASASAAATAAVPGSTVEHANAAAANDPSGAAYVVVVDNAAGSDVTVFEDGAFKVLSTKDGPPGGGGPPGGHGGHPGGMPITGATLSSASAAALAAVPGGTVDDAGKLATTGPNGETYVVDVTKADGSRVDVLEDSAFRVLSVKTPPPHPAGPHGGPR